MFFLYKVQHMRAHAEVSKRYISLALDIFIRKMLPEARIIISINEWYTLILALSS
jgi:hypothetical protein